MKDLEKIVKDLTNEDGVVDWAKATDLVNKEINDVVLKNTGKLDDKLGDAKVEAKQELLKLFEVETTDDLLKKLDDAKQKGESLNDLEGELTKYKQKELLYSQGITDQDKVDYILFNVNKRVNDEVEFEDAYKTYREEKPELFKKEPITFGGGNKPTEAKVEQPGYRKHLLKKHPDLED